MVESGIETSIAPEVLEADVAPELRVEITGSRARGRSQIVSHLVGTVDLSTEELVAEALMPLAGLGASMVVDLLWTRFMSLNGLRILLAVADVAKRCGGSLVVRNPPGTVRRLIELSELGFSLPIDDRSL